ncbi:MAG: DNA alkylation repair protein [Propionicimonas sp.]
MADVEALDLSVIAKQLDQGLRSLGNPERAASERAYLKSGLVHYGTPLPAVRAVLTQATRSTNLDRPAILRLAEELWSVGVHERRVAAVELLAQQASTLEPADLGLLERLLRECRTWALVDPLATRVVGPLVAREPVLGTVLDRWARDGDLWIRRSALLALLVPLRQGAGDFERFARYADAMLAEREFFIRKAIGWVLRDTGRRRPDLVFDWLLPRAALASTVTVREAIKPLSPAQREAILALR